MIPMHISEFLPSCQCFSVYISKLICRKVTIYCQAMKQETLIQAAGSTRHLDHGLCGVKGEFLAHLI